MPIYEFACESCGSRFEKLMRMSDDGLPECPECASAEVRKLISQSGFILKGGGWYRDHYGLKGGGSSSSKSEGGAARRDGKTSTGSSSGEGGGSSAGSSSGSDGGSSSASSKSSSSAAAAK